MVRKQSKKVLIVADPVPQWNPIRETTFCLLEEATRRGYQLYMTELADLGFWKHELRARARGIHVEKKKDLWSPFQYDWKGPHQEVRLKDFDLILVRKDPPLDLTYFLHLQLLVNLEDKVPFCNRPSSILKWNEKLAILSFSESIFHTHVGFPGRVPLPPKAPPLVRKKLFESAGRSVQLLPDQAAVDASNTSGLVASYMMDQTFNAKVADGDKRVLLIDGEVVGLLNRKPKEGGFLSNIRAGGIAFPGKLTLKERKICQSVGRWAKREKVFLIGLDILGEKLSEINLTSVMGILEVRSVGGPDVAPVFWDRIWKSKLT